MIGALVFGFSLLTPRIPAWMTTRPVVGAALIYMGGDRDVSAP